MPKRALICCAANYAAGLTLEDVELILQPMLEEGKEAIGSMGDDAPLAVLSRHRTAHSRTISAKISAK